MKPRMIKLGAVLVAVAAITGTSHAAPYASDVQNSGGTISFRLNENADNVKIVSNGGATIKDLGPGIKGLTSTNYAVAGTFQIVVTRSTPSGYTQLSDDGFQDNGVYVNKYEQPRGIVINKNPATPSFGRIFIANGRGEATTSGTYVRTTYQGVYMLNADNTIALDTGTNPRTAGLGLTPGSTASPNRLNIGKDDNNLYLCDFSDPSGGLWVTDLDVTTGGNVIEGIGDLGYGSTNHGSAYGVAVTGSLADENLKVFTLDEDLTPVRSVWRYDIGGEPLPYTGPQVGPLSTAPINNFVGDLAQGGLNNYLYMTQNRSTGTEANGPGVRVFDQDGNAITNSQSATREFLNNPTAADICRNILALDISADGNTLALLQGADWGGRVMLVSLTNGIFNFAAGTNTFFVGSIGTSAHNNNRDVAFDAAGNLYVINTWDEWMRIYSRGGATVATTGSDGTFDIGVPQTLVGVTATTANANEEGQVNGQFTLTRVGDTSGTLTVNYTTSGTATPGSDYTALPGSVTFEAGAASTNIVVPVLQDTEAEFTETVILNITTGSYGISLNNAVVSIVDNETPELSVSTVQGTLLEGYIGAKATIQVVRKGLLTPSLTANLAYSGSAVRTTDFNAPLSVVLAGNAATTNITVTPIDNIAYSGDKTIIASAASGTGYNVGAATGAITVVDDEIPTGPELFAEDFEVDPSSEWTVLNVDDPALCFAEFSFDYGQTGFGIPPAPRSGGTTKGLRLRKGSSAQNTAISVVPNGQNFTGDYQVSFDMWLNANGPFPGGGGGSTVHFNSGVGTTGGQVNWASGGVADGVWFSADAEGGTGAVTGDYNAYYGAIQEGGGPSIRTLFQDASGVYAAGTTGGPRNNLHPFYGLWLGGLTAPAEQVTLYPGPTAGQDQSGTTGDGNFGMAWHHVVITKVGETVSWAIDGITVVSTTNDVASPFTTTGNIFFGYHDQINGAIDNPDMSFAIVDNVRVQTYTVGPPPSPEITYTHSGNTVMIIWSEAGFTLQQASVLTGSPSDWSDVIGATSPHPVDSSTGAKYFRLKQ